LTTEQVAYERRQILMEKMHVACRKIRLAIARLDAEVPPDEESVVMLDTAMNILAEVKETMRADHQ
jgi:hypothetical protein